MLDPQATLQAWRGAVDEDGYDEIRIEGIIAAGDALAVLVPQLLDQLADVTGLARDYQEQRDILDRTVIRVAAERDALRTTLRSIANHKGSHGGLLIGLARAALGESEAKS